MVSFLATGHHRSLAILLGEKRHVCEKLDQNRFIKMDKLIYLQHPGPRYSISYLGQSNNIQIEHKRLD